MSEKELIDLIQQRVQKLRNLPLVSSTGRSSWARINELNRLLEVIQSHAE